MNVGTGEEHKCALIERKPDSQLTSLSCHSVGAHASKALFLPVVSSQLVSQPFNPSARAMAALRAWRPWAMLLYTIQYITNIEYIYTATAEQLPAVSSSSTSGGPYSYREMDNGVAYGKMIHGLHHRYPNTLSTTAHIHDLLFQPILHGWPALDRMRRSRNLSCDLR